MEAAQNDSVGFVSQTVSDIVELIEGKRQVDVKLIASPAFKLQAQTGVVSPSLIIKEKSSIRSKSRKRKGVGAHVPFPFLSASRLTLQSTVTGHNHFHPSSTGGSLNQSSSGEFLIITLATPPSPSHQRHSPSLQFPQGQVLYTVDPRKTSKARQCAISSTAIPLPTNPPT